MIEIGAASNNTVVKLYANGVGAGDPVHVVAQQGVFAALYIEL